jgi:hypothetical protein
LNRVNYSRPFAPLKLSSEHKSLYTLKLKLATVTEKTVRSPHEPVTVKVELSAVISQLARISRLPEVGVEFV